MFVKLDGYTHYFNNSRMNKNKNNLKCKVLYEKFNELETTSLFIEMSNESAIKITGLYRCHNYVKDKFIKDMNLFIESN